MTAKVKLIQEVRAALADLKRDPYMEYHNKTIPQLREILQDLRRRIT